MRNEQQIFDLILNFAKQEERIRIVMLEGSRTNRCIPKDDFQDYDIKFLVTDMDWFQKSDQWLNQFGTIIMMQKPEAMELFPPDPKGFFSYIMLFDDGVKIDLTLLPVERLEEYLTWDKLMQVLLDKDHRISYDIVPTDEDYHVKKPTAGEYDDCCNEFWNVTSYIVKGLCRNEILFAVDHMNQILRPELLRMLSWKVGIKTGFSLSVGKNYKFLPKYLSKELWERLLSTYQMNGYSQMWNALFTCHQLFREVSKEVGEELRYPYPPYDKGVTWYTKKQYEQYGSVGYEQ
ncbi:MAG: aminoglycoside 6-adenylyltransferase [Massiliimalia sp.]